LLSQVRTAVQISTAAIFTFLVLFFLDRNFRVLPTAIHEYLPTHHAGQVITDVTIATCNSVNPFSKCQLDPLIWHRVDKELYLGKNTFTSAYIHVRLMREEELKATDAVVLDIKVGRIDPSTNEKPRDGVKWESRPGGIWIKRSSKKHASDSKEAVTSVDVLFGEDAVEVREGWAITGTPLILPGKSMVQLTFRRSVVPEPHKPQPRINDNGKFKIVQLADLHLSTGVGKCREAVPPDYHGGKCEADPRTLDFVTRILEDEKPDLVVLSGDQINGDTSPDAQTVCECGSQLR
jgi:hypothetical protein